jgi:hypothetical protein
MSTLSDELITTVREILEEFAPINTRTAYKRAISRVGGSVLLGRSVAISEVDTELVPQPACLRLGRSSPFLQSSSLILVDDWLWVISVESMTRTELFDKDVVLVLKDVLGAEEVFRLIDTTEADV